MKIAIISPFLLRFRRGIESYTVSLARALTDLGADVDIFTIDWPQYGTVPNLSPEIDLWRVPYSRVFTYTVARYFYRRWTKRRKYSWVLVFFAGYGEVGAVRSNHAAHDQKTCIVFHYPREQAPHRYLEFQESALLEHTSKMIAVSEYVADGVREAFGRPCFVIGNGVNPMVFSPSRELGAEIRDRLNIGDKAQVLITTSALEERKGIHWVIRAMPNILNDYPNLIYLVVGEGPFEGGIRSEIRKLGLEDSVLLLGSHGDVVPYLAAADLGILLSKGEAFGISILEYMAMELPVLTSDRPPFDEIIEMEWGRMVDESDTQAVANEIKTILGNPELMRVLGTKGRRQVLQKHTWESVAKEYYRLLDPPN